MPFLERSKLIAEDPVTCARYFHVRVDKFLETVLLPTNMLGNITAWAGVDEFQNSGPQRTVIWCSGATMLLFMAWTLTRR